MHLYYCNLEQHTYHYLSNRLLLVTKYNVRRNKSSFTVCVFQHIYPSDVLR